MLPKDDCLTTETILGYLDKEFTEDENSRIAAHLSGCELCEAAAEGLKLYMADHSRDRLGNILKELEEGIKEKRVAEEQPPHPWFGSGRMWTTIGIAASILILVGIGTVINYMVRQRNAQIALAEMNQKRDPLKETREVQFLPNPNDQIFNEVEESPAFPGGDNAMRMFLAEKISCPANPDGSSSQTSMFVHFVVEEDGSISNVRLISEMGNGCAEEAIRGIESMPKWIPGKQGGQAVKVSYLLMLKFS